MLWCFSGENPVIEYRKNVLRIKNSSNALGETHGAEFFVKDIL